MKHSHPEPPATTKASLSPSGPLTRTILTTLIYTPTGSINYTLMVHTDLFNQVPTAWGKTSLLNSSISVLDTLTISISRIWSNLVYTLVSPSLLQNYPTNAMPVLFPSNPFLPNNQFFSQNTLIWAITYILLQFFYNISCQKFISSLTFSDGTTSHLFGYTTRSNCPPVHIIKTFINFSHQN